MENNCCKPYETKKYVCVWSKDVANTLIHNGFPVRNIVKNLVLNDGSLAFMFDKEAEEFAKTVGDLRKSLKNQTQNS